MKEDCDVYGTWFGENFSSYQEFLGQIKLEEEATFKEMPKNIEINDFVYKLQEE